MSGLLGKAVLLRRLRCQLLPCHRQHYGVYEYGCELFKKRMECAIMIKVAENQELAAKGIEVPIELGSTCNACADGEACE